MPTTIVVDGKTETFGDTSGTLNGLAVAAGQDLSQGARPDLAVGDANALLGRSVGGDDTVAGTLVSVGDAFTLGQHARGGDDAVILTASFSSVIGYGDAEVMRNWAVGGDDTVTGSGDVHSDLHMFGDARTMSGHAVGGDDLLIGPVVASYTALYGDAQTLSDQVQAGDDTLSGPSLSSLPGRPGADLYGDGAAISGNVRCGNDSLSAVSNSAIVRMYGDGQTLGDAVTCGNDTLSGAPAFPVAGSGVTTTLYGDGESLLGRARGGDDLLISRSGDDIMWGDAAVVGLHAATGADRFVFSPTNGHDHIMDFQPGKDRIELDGFGFAGFQDLATHFQAAADGVLISFDANDDILVRSVTPGQLTAADFVFA